MTWAAATDDVRWLGQGIAMAYEFIGVEQEEGLAIITFHRPDKLNALSPMMLQEANDALGQLDRDDGVKVVVLTGEGEAFSQRREPRFEGR